MRKPVVAALALAVLSQAAGCIFVTEGDEGQFDVSWTLSSGSAPVSCDAVGAARVEFLFTADFDSQGYADRFTCADGQGITAPLPVDGYTWVANILDASNNALNEPFDPLSTAIDFDGQVVVLPTVDFAFGPLTQDVAFSVDYGTPGGSNCGTGAAGGNGVVQQNVQLLDETGASCIVADISGTDDPNAGTCTNMLCMESTVVQTIVAVPPGNYTLSVLGYKGAVGPNPVLCYQGNPVAFTVPLANPDLGVIDPPFAPVAADDAACNATKR